MTTPIIYIAGSMSGCPNNNYTQFNDKAAQLRAAGWTVVNPAELDKAAGLDPAAEFTGYDYEDAAARDVVALHGVDAIYMLAGWETSRGASWEHAIATHLGILRYYELPRVDHVEKHKRNISSLAPQNVLENPDKNQPAIDRMVAKIVARSGTSLTNGRSTASAGDDLWPKGSLGEELQRESKQVRQNPFDGRPRC